VAGFAVVVAVVAVVSEVVVAVLSEVDVSVSVRINSVRVRLGSPSASVATETTTVLPDLLSNVMGRVSSGCQDGPAEETNVGRGSAEDGGDACPYPPSPGLGVACSSSKCVEGLPLTPLHRLSSEAKRSDLGASPDSTSLLPSRAFVHRSRDRMHHSQVVDCCFQLGLHAHCREDGQEECREVGSRSEHGGDEVLVVKAAGASDDLCEKPLSPARPVLAVAGSVQRRLEAVDDEPPSSEPVKGRRHHATLVYNSPPPSRYREVQETRLCQKAEEETHDAQRRKEATDRKPPSRLPTQPPAPLSSVDI
jgi:hypothetical protein